MSRMNDRVIIVTGAAGGIGYAIAHTLVERGARVVATGRREPQKTANGATFLLHDVASDGDWDRVIRATIERFGRLDGLVNNAGHAELGPILETSTEMFEKTLRVNQIGTFLGMKKFAEAANEKGSAIVNISSCVATRGTAGQFAYAASKWAIRGMTKCAAIELAAKGIRVNSINPGMIETPMIDAFPEDQRSAIKNAIPMGRFGEPHEIAAITAFLLSDEASYMTGAEIGADGGAFA